MPKRHKKTKRRRTRSATFSPRSFLGLGLILLGILSFITFFWQSAEFGVFLQNVLGKYFGWATFMMPFVLVVAGLNLLLPGKYRVTTVSFLISLVAFTLFLAALFHLFLPFKFAHTRADLGEGGGLFGYAIQLILRTYITFFGALLVILSGLVGSVLFMLNVPFENFVNVLHVGFTRIRNLRGQSASSVDAEAYNVAGEENYDYQLSTNDLGVEEPSATQDSPKFEILKPKFSPDKPALVGEDPAMIETISNLAFPDRVWEHPPISLLSDGPKTKLDRSHLNQNAKIIEQTLESFGVTAKVIHVNLGPSVTQYVIELAHGTRLNRVTNLKDDLARALASPSGTVRLEAPIAGTSHVGVEVPNQGLKVVALKNVLTSGGMENNKSLLSVALGEDVSGNAVIADIAQMPHVLIAGTTGSGKSVLINAMLATLLFRCSPWQLKLILVDPKRVELTQYRGIPHLLTDVIVEPDKVVSALRWALDEMQKRYSLFETAGVRNINGYNEAAGFQSLPYIVIMIDELADLMMTAPREVEAAICRLAQLSRATGIHLIVATQRPSVDVITGLIKANIPCRIAFNVSSTVDSRVIIDQPGAQTLLGRGDMLYVPPDSSRPQRIQGVYVEEREVRSLIEFLKKSGVAPDYKMEILEYVGSSKGEIGGMVVDDEALKDAAQLVIDEGFASTSLIQRKLRVGYNRAANLIDELEAHGVVSSADGARRRHVLISNIIQMKGMKNDGESGATPQENTRVEVPHI